MDLEAFLLVVVGGLLTAGGGFLAQWWSGRQADAREVRDRNHEQRVWARQLRYDTHISFLNDFEQVLNTAVLGEIRDPDGSHHQLPDDYLVPLYDRLVGMRAISEEQTTTRAGDAVNALAAYVFDRGGSVVEVGIKHEMYLDAMRGEIGLPRSDTSTEEIEIIP
jgi:hypothetical protein